MREPQLNVCKIFQTVVENGFYNPSHILNGSSGVDVFGVHSKLFNNLGKSNFLASFSLLFSFM